MNPPKQQLLTQWHAELRARLRALESGQAAARAGTRVDGSHRPENRGERAAVTTQGYLAHGLQQRIQSLAEQLRLLDEVGFDPREQVVVGAWISLETETGARREIAILPGGDATTLTVDTHRVQILSPDSPLVQPLRGLEAGDGAEVQGLGEVEIMEVR